MASKSISRHDLVNSLAARAGLTAIQANAVLSAFEEEVAALAGEPDKPAIRTKIGVFKGAVRSARTARNPVTGEPVSVAAKAIIKYKQSSAL
jgi:DNA-binding protein HU-beta